MSTRNASDRGATTANRFAGKTVEDLRPKTGEFTLLRRSLVVQGRTAWRDGDVWDNNNLSDVQEFIEERLEILARLVEHEFKDRFPDPIRVDWS